MLRQRSCSCGGKRIAIEALRVDASHRCRAMRVRIVASCLDRERVRRYSRDRRARRPSRIMPRRRIEKCLLRCARVMRERHRMTIDDWLDARLRMM